MGRGSQGNTKAEPVCTRNSSSEQYFTKKEVAKHNARNDMWIILKNKVYNVTEFQHRHPGGSKILKIYAGQDATEVFIAFHKDYDKVNKYLKTYCIGSLNPNDLLAEEPTVLSLNNQEIERIHKLKQMREDLHNLREAFKKMGLFDPSYTFFLLHALQIVFLHVLGFYILWNYGYDTVPLLAALSCHIIAQAQAAWTQHDYGHSSIFKKPKHNQLVQAFFLGLIKGACAEWWTNLHNQHHAKPNVVSLDRN